MIRYTKHERRLKTTDLATRHEAYWLDQLAKERPDLGRCRVTDRDRGGQFRYLTVDLRCRLSGAAFGCIAANLAWVKREVLRCRQQRKRREVHDAWCQLGAYI